MEPVKFEENIKKQLQKREITPSAVSWEKLEARLEQEERPRRAQFWWIGVAAAIAGMFFFLGTLFNDSAEPAVVEQTSEEFRIQEPMVVEQDSEEILSVESVKKPEKEVLVTSEETKVEKVPKHESLPKERKTFKTETAVAAQERPVQNTFAEPEDIEFVADPKAEHAIAEAEPAISKDSNAEVDALLKTAMAELEQEQAAYAVQPVNAEQLLQEVEFELDQNFRQKVFEVLKEGFSKAKTAVANRNY